MDREVYNIGRLMSNLDVLILIPLTPAAPILITWYLPWERWLPRALPKFLLGPYMLYGAFAAWHFKLPWWCVLLLVAYGVVVFLLGVRERMKTKETSGVATPD